jgi:hypothetical protein
MREMFKEYSFHTPKLWLRFGLGTMFYCAILLGTIMMFPHRGYGQGLYGDPSTTLGQWGKFRLEVGTGSTVNPNLKINNKPVSLKVNQGTFNLIASDTTVAIRTKQVFYTVTLGLGNSLDAFLKVGQFKVEDGFDGSTSPSGGLGFRFSPPQTSHLKLGFLFQVFQATSENNGFDTSVDILFDTDSRGIQRHITATGTGKDKLSLTQYDALLSLSIQDIPYVRPYGALLVSFQDRTEKGSFSGQGNLTTCPGGHCLPPATGPVDLSWNTDVSTDSVVGGVLGLSLSPIEWVGINLEGFLGAGHLGTQYGYTASAFVQF